MPTNSDVSYASCLPHRCMFKVRISIGFKTTWQSKIRVLKLWLQVVSPSQCRLVCSTCVLHDEVVGPVAKMHLYRIIQKWEIVLKKRSWIRKKTLKKHIYDDYVLEWNIDVYQKYVNMSLNKHFESQIFIHEIWNDASFFKIPKS